MTDDDKDRIRKEEVFRFEVRRSLEPPKTISQRVLAFFNTALGIWLLSSVVVTSISLVYTKHQDEKAEAKRIQDRRNELRIEVEIRASQWAHRVAERLQVSDEITPAEFAQLYQTLLDPPASERAKQHGIYSAFTEFEKRSLISLVQEVRVLAATQAESKQSTLAQSFLLEWNPATQPQSRISAYLFYLKKSPIEMDLRKFFPAQFRSVYEEAAATPEVSSTGSAASR
jgi:hypothetical protein